MEDRSRTLPRGFTLIEVVVTISVIAVIFGIAANGFNRINSGSTINSQIELLVSDIRTTVLSALNSEQFQLETSYGWGIYLDGDNNRYTIFADLDNDASYDTKEKVKSVELRPNLVMYMSWEMMGNPTGTLYFLNDTGIVSFSGDVIAADDLEIILTDTVTNIVKTISVNSFGAVSHD